MSSIFPNDGVPPSETQNAVNVATTGCGGDASELFYDVFSCNNRLNKSAMNAIMSEILNLSVCASLPWDCTKLNNLCTSVLALQTHVTRGTNASRFDITASHRRSDWTDVTWKETIATPVGDVWKLNVPDENGVRNIISIYAPSATFVNPTFYVTEGAPAPNTALFTPSGNTLETAFGSTTALLSFIVGARVFGSIKLNVKDTWHNIVISQNSISGLSLLTVQVRDNNAENLIIEYAKVSTGSSGITANGVKVIIFGGCVTEGFGFGNTQGSFNSPFSSVNGGEVEIRISAVDANQYVRHTGLHPIIGTSSIVFTITGSKFLMLATDVNQGDLKQSPKEFFNLQGGSATNKFLCVDRLGDGCDVTRIGIDRVLSTDFHAENDVNANQAGQSLYQYVGNVTASQSKASVKGPGFIYIHEPNYRANIIRACGYTVRILNDNYTIGSSTTTYRSVMRYRTGDGSPISNIVFFDGVQSAFNFSKDVLATNTTDFGNFVGKIGVDLPVGT